MKAKRMLAFILAAAMVFGDITPVLAAAPSEYTEQNVIPEETVSEGPSSETPDPEQKESGDNGPSSDSGDSETGEEVSGKEPAPGESAPDGSLKDPSTNPDGDVPEDKEDTEGEEAPGNPEDADGTESEAPVSEETISGEKESASGEEELVFGEVDASEYILQDGGNGILPEDENGGISFFSLNEERLMAAIAEGLRNRQASIDIKSFGIHKDALMPFYIKVINNNPSLFYAKSGYKYSYNPENNTVSSIIPLYDEQYDDNSSRQYEEAVQEALKAVNDQMDDLEKALALHDYLVLNCAYENDGGGNYKNYNAYNALVDGECVCQGYTLAYTDLLQRVGIPVTYATSDAMNHIWNMVELDNQWYHVDATWDDPTPDLAGRVKHNHFLHSDSGITATGHYSWETGVDGAKGTDDSYASGKFWNGLNTAVFYEDDVCYYLSDTGSITERSDDGSETVIYRMTDTRWPVWNGSGSWVGIFSGLSRSGDYLYCNDKLNVYQISISSSTASMVYTYEDGDGYLYGSCVKEDEIHLTVTQDPNNIPVRKKVLLPQEDLEPFMNPRFSWNTVDGETVRSTNTDGNKMKLVIFVPVNRIAKDSLYQPLLLGKKYIDAVVLDTSGMDAAAIRTRRSESEKLVGIKSNTSALTYCYDTGGAGVKNAFLTYCAQAGIEYEYTENTMACFLIDQNNRIVHWDTRSASEDSPVGMLWLLASVINENGYLHSGLASAGAQIKENKAGRITVQWNAVSGASGYRIYSSDQIDGHYMECAYKSTVDKREWTDEFVPILPDKTNEVRYYKVIAVDSYGIAGDPGNPVTNEGMPTDQDPLSFKELHLLDEEGNEVTSVELHAGETRRFGLELERYNGTKVRIENVEYPVWGIWKPLEETAGENLTISDCQIDESEEYAFWWYKELTNRSMASVTGVKATDGTQRYLSCQASGRIGDYSYNEHLFFPVHVAEAEAGVTYPQPDMTPGDCYTDKDAMYQYIRDQIRDHASEISFCVPQTLWDEWSQGHIMKGEWEWTPLWDAVDFYEDRKDMEPWEGDYLFYSLAPFDFGGMEMSYRGTEYQIYTINCSYWDNKSQEEKVTAKMQELIHEPSGALYQYHNSPEHEIVKACMTWIRNNVSYIGTSDARYHSAYSALFNKKATCEGYSLLLYRMLREFGISNRILMGVDEGAHTYNIVEIDGSYYYTDPSGNIVLKGSNNFRHADWQERFLDDEFTEKTASRISKTDYVYVPKYVRLLQVSGESETLTGNYSTFAQAAAEMKAGEAYRIVLLGNVSLSTGDELALPETVTCEVNLNGYTLTVPSSSTGESHIRADLYGGDTKKGVIKTAKNQCLVLDPTSDRGMSVRNLTFGFDAASTAGGLNLKNTSVDQPLMFTNVTITGTPNVELGSNVIVDASSSFTVGTLKVSADSEQVVLNGKVTAKRFEYAATDLSADNLTVSGETVVTDGGRLRVTGTATFAKVTVNDQVFYLDLIKTLDSDGNTAGTGTVTFTGALAKALIPNMRWNLTDGQ